MAEEKLCIRELMKKVKEELDMVDELKEGFRELSVKISRFRRN